VDLWFGESQKEHNNQKRKSEFCFPDALVFPESNTLPKKVFTIFKIELGITFHGIEWINEEVFLE